MRACCSQEACTCRPETFSPKLQLRTAAPWLRLWLNPKLFFLERASRVGLPDEAVRRLVDQGIDTMSKLAFAPCQPGETPSEESLTGLIQTEGAEPSRGSIAAVRHLVFEAQTLLVSQTKALVENREAETKDLAPAERRERIKTQSLRLAGITMSGQSECSFASYDLCMKLITGELCLLPGAIEIHHEGG